MPSDNMNRIDFPEPTKRLVAERAAFVCTNPDCRRPTIGASRADANSSIKPGVAAHICAASKGGPRFDPNQTPEERQSAGNCIWLCGTCSMLIDKNGGIDHPASLLRIWKDQHELETFSAISSGRADSGLCGWCEEDSGSWSLYVKNTTMSSYYDCVVYGYRLEHCNESFADIEVVFGIIPPRQTVKDKVGYGALESQMFGHPLVELEYTDTSGQHWRRHHCGKLQQIPFRRPFD
jgi:hypothetical protein